jgi:hypothetical protein
MPTVGCLHRAEGLLLVHTPEGDGTEVRKIKYFD